MKKTAQSIASPLSRLIRGHTKRAGTSGSTRIHPDPDWAAKVLQGLSFLFSEHGATLVDSISRDDSFGLKTAVINVGNIILSVSRDATLPQEYIEARIAPVHVPNEFKPPHTACAALMLIESGKIPDTPDYEEFGTFDGLSKLLRRNFVQLNEAFAVANYPSIREKIIEIEQQHWRDWERQHSHRITSTGCPGNKFE